LQGQSILYSFLATDIQPFLAKEGIAGAFEAAGLLLVVAAVGALVLGKRQP